MPLCAAACWGHTETVRELFAHGADPDLREDHGTGWSPLEWANNGTHPEKGTVAVPDQRARDRPPLLHFSTAQQPVAQDEARGRDAWRSRADEPRSCRLRAAATGDHADEPVEQPPQERQPMGSGMARTS